MYIIPNQIIIKCKVIFIINHWVFSVWNFGYQFSILYGRFREQISHLRILNNHNVWNAKGATGVRSLIKWTQPIWFESVILIPNLSLSQMHYNYITVISAGFGPCALRFLQGNIRVDDEWHLLFVTESQLELLSQAPEHGSSMPRLRYFINMFSIGIKMQISNHIHNHQYSSMP